MNDNFFDIVFDVIIDKESYDFEKNEFKEKAERNLWRVGFIGINGIIFLGCLYTLIFILIPIIKYRISQCCRKRERRYSEINDRIGKSHISLMKERLNQ